MHSERATGLSASLDVLRSMSTEDGLQWLSRLKTADDPLLVLDSLRAKVELDPSPSIPGSPSELTVAQAQLSPSRPVLDYKLRETCPMFYPIALQGFDNPDCSDANWFLHPAHSR